MRYKIKYLHDAADEMSVCHTLIARSDDLTEAIAEAH